MPLPAFQIEPNRFYLSNDSNQVYHVLELTFEAGALYRAYNLLTCQPHTLDTIPSTIADFASSVRRVCTPAEIENLKIPPYLDHTASPEPTSTIYLLQWQDSENWSTEGFAQTIRQALQHYRAIIKDHSSANMPWRIAQYGFIQAQPIDPPKANHTRGHRPANEEADKR